MVEHWAQHPQRRVSDTRDCDIVHLASNGTEYQKRLYMKVEVTADGWLKDPSIQPSTGYPRLDQACLDALAGGHLIPATENGIAIDRTIALPMV